MVEDSPTALRMATVAGSVTADASPVVVRLTLETSLVGVTAGLTMIRMTMLAQDWASELSRR